MDLLCISIAAVIQLFLALPDMVDSLIYLDLIGNLNTSKLQACSGMTLLKQKKKKKQRKLPDISCHDCLKTILQCLYVNKRSFRL